MKKLVMGLILFLVPSVSMAQLKDPELDQTMCVISKLKSIVEDMAYGASQEELKLIENQEISIPNVQKYHSNIYAYEAAMKAIEEYKNKDRKYPGYYAAGLGGIFTAGAIYSYWEQAKFETISETAKKFSQRLQPLKQNPVQQTLLESREISSKSTHVNLNRFLMDVTRPHYLSLDLFLNILSSEKDYSEVLAFFKQIPEFQSQTVELEKLLPEAGPLYRKTIGIADPASSNFEKIVQDAFDKNASLKRAFDITTQLDLVTHQENVREAILRSVKTHLGEDVYKNILKEHLIYMNKLTASKMVADVQEGLMSKILAKPKSAVGKIFRSGEMRAIGPLMIVAGMAYDLYQSSFNKKLTYGIIQMDLPELRNYLRTHRTTIPNIAVHAAEVGCDDNL